MPYEVTKKVSGREYRYRVERFRDPQTGKMRSRWTYLGRAGGAVPRKRGRGESTRESLIEAIGVLVERTAWNEITVEAIAQAAGVAHGTMYRHFTDRWDLLRAAVERRRADLDRERPRFDGPTGTPVAERARLRAWLLSVLSLPVEHPGLVRAYAALTAEFPTEARQREVRRIAAEGALASYLAKLAKNGLIVAPHQPAELSRAFFVAIEGVYKRDPGSGRATAESIARGMADLFERAIFGPG